MCIRDSPWGNPLTETYTDTNFSGIDNSNNYTGYTWDEVLDLCLLYTSTELHSMACPFPDVSQSNWAYGNIMEAAITHKH